MKKILFFLTSVALLASCSNNDEMEIAGVNTSSVQSFDVNVAPFVGDDCTRTNIGNGTNITWAYGDQLGIWPKQVVSGQLVQQLQFNIVASDINKATAKFTGTGWGMITDGSYTYYANYPYATGAEPDNVEFTLTDDLSQDELGKNDVAWAAPITPTSPEGVNFTFKHLGTLVKFVVTLPADADGVEFSSLKLYANEDIFTKTITYNPSEAVTEGETPTLSATKKTNILSVSLGNVVPQDNKISAYVLALPSELINKSFDIELTPAEGNFVYVAHAMAFSNWDKGKLKTYKVEASERVELGTDLSVNASGETATANSYIISAAGKYNFLANVRGNGVDPIADDDENATIKGAESVEVLWETVNTKTAPTVGTIIKSIRLLNNRVVFSTPETFTEGNALISVKDASGNILWSWHIWATSATIETQTYGGVNMMDRNLGALCNDSTEAQIGKVYGFHYQWGRPFPMVIDVCQKTTLARPGTWEENAEKTTAEKGTLAYSRQHPATFIFASAEQVGTDAEGNWYWGSAPFFWLPVKKTMYDPCPIGWRVPADNTQWSGFTKDLTSWTNHVTPVGTQAIVNGRFVKETPSIYYPSAGFRGTFLTAQSSALTYIGNYGFYLSSTTTNGGAKGSSLFFYSTNLFNTYSYVRAGGCSVRPEKE